MSADETITGTPYDSGHETPEPSPLPDPGEPYPVPDPGEPYPVPDPRRA